jgi:hypothetical protein
MQKRKLRKNLFLIPLFIFLILIIYLNYPYPKKTIKSSIDTPLNNSYELSLRYPEQIWYGETEGIFFQLDQIPADILDNGLDEESYIKNLEIDFVLSGAELTPPGRSVAALLPDKDISLQWKVKPFGSGNIRGSIWVYINSLSNDNQTEKVRELIFTHDISIQVLNFMNMNILVLRWILVFGLAISIGLFFLWKN